MDPDQPRRAAVTKTIRHKYRTLTSKVSQGYIPAELYSKGIIGDETLEIANKRALIDRDKGNAIMKEVQKALKSDPDLFTVFCKVLAEESSELKKLSEELEGTANTILKIIEGS